MYYWLRLAHLLYIHVFPPYPNYLPKTKNEVSLSNYMFTITYQKQVELCMVWALGTKRDINFYESLSLSKLSNIIVAQKSYGALLYKPINQTPWWSASGFRLLILRTCSRFKSAESTRFPIIHVLWSTKNYTKTVVYPYYLSSIVVGLPTIPMFQPSSPLTIAHCLPL